MTITDHTTPEALSALGPRGVPSEHGESQQAGADDGKSMIRVFIVTGVRLFREGLAHVLRREPGIAVVGACEDYGEFVQRVAERHVDVALVDTSSSEGLAAIRNGLSAAPGVRMIALGMTEDGDHVHAYAESGVSGFVHHGDSIDDLLAAIDRIARGEMSCSPRIAAALVRHVASLAAERETNGGGTHLTRRELEIVGLIDEGLSNKQIARRLQIELATVKNHVHNILEKLHVTNRLEAAAQVRRAGIGTASPETQNGSSEARKTLRI